MNTKLTCGRAGRLGGCLFLLLLLVWGVPGCEKREPVSFLQDEAGVLTASEHRHIEDYHRRLLDDLDIHLQVVLLRDRAPDLDALALQLFERYEIGRPTAGARGVLLLVDPQAGEVRMEVGYDLEGLFTDLFVARVEREQMAPFFAAGKVGPGLEGTVELLVAHALENGHQDIAKGGLPHLSGGGGARTAAPIGQEPAAKSAAAEHGRFSAQPTPRGALERYLDLLHARIKDPDLQLYTPETRDFMRRWVVTDGQQNREWRDLSRLLPMAEELCEGDLAVLRFPPSERQNPPYFLRRGAEGWMLDFTLMGRVIGFNHRNEWHFRSSAHPYRFAFVDWQFDPNGYPLP